MQNKNVYIPLGVVIFLIVAGGGYFLFFSNTSKAPEQVSQEEDQQEEVVVPTISPDDLGLTFQARNDKRAVKFTIAEIKGIQAVDYEISYLAKGDIPRGAIGHIEVKPGDKRIETNYIDLGTCSSGRCKYDEGVREVKLILKIVKTDGKSYSSEKSLDL